MRISTVPQQCQQGFSILEVLISMLVLAFGLLGMGALQISLQTTYTEALQQSQAVQIMRDMAERLNANTANVDAYVTGPTNPLGVGDGLAGDCDAAGLTLAQQDRCVWSQRLKGVSAMQGTSALGAMEGARGCVEVIQVQNPTDGICTPGIYRVSVAWQGSLELDPPDAQLACAAGKYGDEKFRRLITSTIMVGTLSCSL